MATCKFCPFWLGENQPPKTPTHGNRPLETDDGKPNPGGDDGFATEGDPEKPLVLFFNPAALEDRK